MSTGPFANKNTPHLGIIIAGAFAVAGVAMPASAQNVAWVVETIPGRAPVETCKAVIISTARGAVQRCIAKVGVVIPFDDFVATAASSPQGARSMAGASCPT